MSTNTLAFMFAATAEPPFERVKPTGVRTTSSEALAFTEASPSVFILEPF